MTIDEIKTMVNTDPSYEFLKTNPHLGDNIMFLCLGGSYAYGTNMETSDVDVRGVALNRPEDLLGLSTFDQVVNETTDTTIYSFVKLVRLLLNCNPNCIELLGDRPEHYLYVSELGRRFLDAAPMFLSQRAIQSFGGYATSQFMRLENALARDRLPQSRREEHVLNSMQSGLDLFDYTDREVPKGAITLFTDKSDREDLDLEIFANIELKHYPARAFAALLNHLKGIMGSYDKVNGRNHKKDEAHLDKHAMHLIRLYLILLDILEKHEIVTYREEEHDLLMAIRNGYYRNPDATYKPEFFRLVDSYKKRVEEAKARTTLPKHPDMKAVEAFVMEINREAF